MKLWLIKIGKAWEVLKRDGLWRGSHRIFSAFFRLFGRVGKGEILFVTNGVGDSARYRTHHVAEELRFQGFRVSVTVQDNPFLLSYVEKFSVFIFHRVLFTDKIKIFVDTLEQTGKELIFEADDLVYDPKYLKDLEYFKKMNALEKQLYTNGLGGEILVHPAVRAATTTTTFLAEKLSAKGKQVFLVPNRLSKEDLTMAQRFFTDRTMRGTQREIRIGYMSGTASHNTDFATVAEVLAHLLERFPQIKLVLAGPLEIGESLKVFGGRIERLPFANRQKHFANLSHLDINLAPLIIGDPFCESKSELKFFEAGIVGVPTVAAATQTFREAIADGVDGFVAQNQTEWQEKLEKLITDDALRKRMGEAARKKVLERYTTKSANNVAYYDFLRSKIKP